MIQALKPSVQGIITELVDGIPSAVSAEVYKGTTALHSATPPDGWSSAVSAHTEQAGKVHRFELDTEPPAGILHEQLCCLGPGGLDHYGWCVGYTPAIPEGEGEEPSPAVPATIDIEGLSGAVAATIATIGRRRLAVSIPASALAELGDDYRVEWAYTALGSEQQAVTDFEVVRKPVLLALPLSVFLAANPGYNALLTTVLTKPHTWGGIAAKAADMVDDAMHSRGKRVHLVVQQDRLNLLLDLAARYVLATQGVVPQGGAPTLMDYSTELLRQFEDKATDILGSAYTEDPATGQASPGVREGIVLTR